MATALLSTAAALLSTAAALLSTAAALLSTAATIPPRTRGLRLETGSGEPAYQFV